MTAALYARMVDQRRCRWGASVASLFPSIRSHPAWADLHVEDLLSHAAGLTDGFVDGAWLDARRADAATVTKQRLALVERVLALPPPERSGVYRYGNLNYVLVGAAIEQATGRTWEQVMSAELFAPLRIGEAGFGAPPRAGPWGRSADEHGLRSIDPLGAADNPAVLWPSGGVHITTSGYAQFLSLFLRAGTPLLRRETLAHLLTPAKPDLRYAGGWSLEGRSSAPTDTLTHDGSNTLWFATAIVERTSGHGYAAMANCGGQRGIATTDRLLQRLRKRPALA
jgi:CubicO group peptidase (beta-lactamase class C family)